MMDFIEVMIRNDVKKKIVSMSQGNIGCLQFLTELLRDPNGTSAMITLNDLEILGSRAYQLWNDCCNRNTQQTIEILALVNECKITKEELEFHIDRPYGIPFDMDEIRARKPEPVVKCVKYHIDDLDRSRIGEKEHLNMIYRHVMEKLFRDSTDIGKTFMVTVNKVVNNEGTFLEAIKKEVQN